jgi:hypothetical protein
LCRSVEEFVESIRRLDELRHADLRYTVHAQVDALRRDTASVDLQPRVKDGLRPQPLEAGGAADEGRWLEEVPAPRREAQRHHHAFGISHEEHTTDEWPLVHRDDERRLGGVGAAAEPNFVLDSTERADAIGRFGERRGSNGVRRDERHRRSHCVRQDEAGADDARVRQRKTRE